MAGKLHSDAPRSIALGFNSQDDTTECHTRSRYLRRRGGQPNDGEHLGAALDLMLQPHPEARGTEIIEDRVNFEGLAAGVHTADRHRKRVVDARLPRRACASSTWWRACERPEVGRTTSQGEGGPGISCCSAALHPVVRTAPCSASVGPCHAYGVAVDGRRRATKALCSGLARPC